MSVKQQFLDELRNELRKYPSGQVDDLIEYYDELISERVANGAKESEIITQIDSPRQIAANFRADFAIDEAAKKPSMRSGVKAMFAVLGVLSLPLLIPAALVAVALIVTFCAVIISVLAGLVSVVAAAIAGVVEMAMVVASGEAPLYLLIIVVGLALILIPLAAEAIRGLIILVRKVTKNFIDWLKKRTQKKETEK